jgi:RNase P subunit RPR2
VSPIRICKWCGIKIRFHPRWKKTLRGFCHDCTTDLKAGTEDKNPNRPYMSRFPVPRSVITCQACFGLGCGICHNKGRMLQTWRVLLGGEQDSTTTAR